MYILFEKGFGHTTKLKATLVVVVLCLFAQTNLIAQGKMSLSAAMDSANQFILRAGTQYGGHTCAAYAMGASMISEHSAFIADWNTYKSSL